MRKIGVLIILLISLISIVQANLFINPNPIDVTLKAGETKQFSLTLNNSHQFQILDFQFSNLSGFTFPNVTLNANETKTIFFNVSRTEATVTQIQSTVSFNYLVDIPQGERTHNVTILQNSGFQPSFLTIRKGDTVKWTNRDTISRTVTSGLFDETIQPNQSFSYIFTETGEVTYQDLVLFFGGTIRIINETESERVNNPDFNKILTVNLAVTLDPTSILLTIDQSNFTVTATGSQESILRVKNTGNITAQRVVLSGNPNWIIFDENNFDLLPNEENIVTYHIEPLIFETAETNKTYNVELSAKASNTEKMSKTLQIFVPFSDLSNINSNEGFLIFFARYCLANPNLIVCNNTLGGGGDGEVIIRDPEITANLSTRELLEALRRIQGIEDSVSRTSNEQKQLNDLINTMFPDFHRLLNESLSRQDEVEKISDTRTRVFWIFAIAIVISGGIVIIGLTTRKYLKRRSIIEQGYKTRWY